MNNQTMGAMVAALRKEKGMTQADLAARMGVTDKAVSKWERDLSLPDVHSIPKLAQVLGISVEELMGSRCAKRGGEEAPPAPGSPGGQSGRLGHGGQCHSAVHPGKSQHIHRVHPIGHWPDLRWHLPFAGEKQTRAITESYKSIQKRTIFPPRERWSFAMYMGF